MENKNWFVHVEWVVVLLTLLGGFYLLDGKIERQGQRTDRIYEMFVDVRKDMDNRFQIVDQKFYDLLKETKCPPALR